MGGEISSPKVRSNECIVLYCIVLDGEFTTAVVLTHRHRDDDVLVLTYLLTYCRLEDLVAHEDIINILTNLIDNDNLPHLLLYGPPGTGKVGNDLCVYCACIVYCVLCVLWE
jgi:hypothetical protein